MPSAIATTVTVAGLVALAVSGAVFYGVGPQLRQSAEPVVTDGGELELQASEQASKAALSRIVVLEQALDSMQSRYATQQGELRELQSRLEELALNVEQERLAEVLMASDQSDHASAPSTESRIESASQAVARRPGRVDLDQRDQWLAQAGVSADRIAAIRERDDARALRRLEIIDRAAREGREHDPSVADELAALEGGRNSLRTELGDDQYAEYLRSAGLPDQVQVVEVIGGSAAASAGVEAGDIVLRYADERVFDIGDLQSLTRSGVRGEAVAMELEREGTVLLATVPRGPLGVSLAPRQRQDD